MPTSYQLELMKHALGMASKNSGYRNYFDAEPGGEDAKQWDLLVREGLAIVTREPADPFPGRIYAVSDAGKKVVGMR